MQRCASVQHPDGKSYFIPSLYTWINRLKYFWKPKWFKQEAQASAKKHGNSPCLQLYCTFKQTLQRIGKIIHITWWDSVTLHVNTWLQKNMQTRLGPHKYLTIFFLLFWLFLTCSKSEFKFLTQKCTIEVTLWFPTRASLIVLHLQGNCVQVNQEIRRL